MRFSYFIGLIFIFSCSLPTMPCNTKDENAPCYLASPSGVEISSYDVDAIRIRFDQNNQADEINLRRTMNGVYDTSFTLSVVVENNEINIIDDKNIIINNDYSYEFIYIDRDDGESKVTADSSTAFSHLFIAPDYVNINLFSSENENTLDSLNVSWSSTNQYEIYRDSIHFEVSKKISMLSNSGLDTLETIITSTILSFEIDMNHESNNKLYTFTEPVEELEENQIILYEYSVREFRRGDSSGEINYTSWTNSDIFVFDIPSIADFGWIPLSANSMLIYWDFQGEIDDGEIYSLSISNPYSNDLLQGEGIINFNTPKGYYIDTIELSASQAGGKEELVYHLEWCSDPNTCGEKRIKTATFPIYNMVYVPIFSSFENSEENYLSSLSSLSEGFYIDLFEVSEHLFNTCENNDCYNDSGVPIINNLPKSLDQDEALVWTETKRTTTFSFEQNNVNINFRLPKQSEWMIAAGVSYNINSLDIVDNTLQATPDDSFYYTPYQSGGLLMCNHANIFTCNGEEIQIGSYEQMTSPLGLYDCSGNLMEWVLNEELDQQDILMGGFYNSPPNNAQSNSSLELICSGNSCIGTGFRTLIEADSFLVDWKML